MQVELQDIILPTFSISIADNSEFIMQYVIEHTVTFQRISSDW